jgi:uncharacterized FlgJ-related protein
LKQLRYLSASALIAALCLTTLATSASSQEVIVFGGVDDVIRWLKAENWWGEENRGEQLDVPHAMITGINARWRETSQQLPVLEKKAIFYRLMLPLIVHANDMVLTRRAAVIRMREQLAAGEELSAADLDALRRGLVLLRVVDDDAASSLTAANEKLPDMIEEALYKLDEIPAGLVLGQAAYESGYGTSRFAVEGNALFGQWTFGGDGIVPDQQRENLGDHRIAAFDWPFDSVRGYFLNLMTHPAYEEFRRLRAEMRAAGKPLTSLELADGLIRYSERGQEYVDTLKGMIRVNHLDIADGAKFRDEPIRFLIGAKDAAAVPELQKEIERLRESGELARIIARMRLE